MGEGVSTADMHKSKPKIMLWGLKKKGEKIRGTLSIGGTNPENLLGTYK